MPSTARPNFRALFLYACANVDGVYRPSAADRSQFGRRPIGAMKRKSSTLGGSAVRPSASGLRLTRRARLDAASERSG